jgi:hypothetical protein
MTSLALLLGVATAECRRRLHVRLMRLCSCMVAAVNDCTSIEQTDLPDTQAVLLAFNFHTLQPLDQVTNCQQKCA